MTRWGGWGAGGSAGGWEGVRLGVCLVSGEGTMAWPTRCSERWDPPRPPPPPSPPE